MADNRSLDEFVAGEESADPEPTDPDDPKPGESAGTEADDDQAGGDDSDDEVVPMAETFAWSAAGGECATCGEPVEERWRDGDVLVCGDCKAW